MGSKSRRCKEAKRRGKNASVSEQKTKKLIDLMNDYSKDSDSETVIELLPSDANSDPKDKGLNV
jgi:hypothetical protein